MRWNLLPREPYFFEAFVSMTREVQRGAGLLVDLLATQPLNVELVPAIHDVEHACDEITHDIINHLNKTFVTPIDREDVHALAKALDDVMDAIDDASTRLPMHRVTDVRAGARELARAIAAQTAQLALAAEHLPKMTRFVLTAVHEIKRLEGEADRLHMRAVGDLFDNERDAIEAIKWKEIFDFLENASDRAEEAAHVIEGIYVKHG